MFLLLEIDDVSCSVPGRELFGGLSFNLARGQSMAIVGESGIGKSTLIRAILGLRVVDSGEIRILGNSMTRASQSEKLRLRREHIGVVHQDGQLIEELSATENVAVALMLQHDPPQNSMELARKAVNEAGVPPDTLVAQLSGGERQRAALVRALIAEPDLILADEPTGSLDSETRDKMSEYLFGIAETHRLGLIVVTHDFEVAKRADRIIQMEHYVVASSAS